MGSSDTIRLYKFYSLCSALKNLKQRRLKISTVDDLNDPFEFNSFALTSERDRKVWKEVRQQLWSDKGIICFSEDWRNPLMWSHYSDNHRGLCLGFDVVRSKMTKVSYQEARELVGKLKDLLASGEEDPFKRHTSTKFAHWSYEEEWRAFCRLEDKDEKTGLYFVNFSDELQLREIIIGAECELASTELLKLFDGEKAPEIITARLAFNDFAVVKQRNKALQK